MFVMLLYVYVLRIFIILGHYYAYTAKVGQTTFLERHISVFGRNTSPITLFDEADDVPASLISLIQEDVRPVLKFDYRSFYSFLGHRMKTALELPTETECRRHLKFLVVCGKECLQEVIRYANEMDISIGQRSLLRHFSTWLIISPDHPPDLNTTLDNVALISVSMSRPLLNIKQNSTIKDLITNSEERKVVWKNCEVYTLLWMPASRSWSRVLTRDVPLDHLHDSLFPNSRMGLNGRELIVSTLEWMPHAIRKSVNGELSYVGVGPDIITLLGIKLNFSFIFVEPRDMLWGQQMENGTFTGVLGMLERMETDMCAVPYSLSSERSKIMDVSSPVFENYYYPMYRKRPNGERSWLFLLSCFSWEVYICGSATLLWMVLLRFALNYGKTEQMFSEVGCITPFEIALHVPLRQGLYASAILVLPESSSLRIFTWTWCLFCLVMTAVYTGKFVAVATVNKYNPPFTTLQELSQQDEYAIGVMEGDYSADILQNSDNPTLKLIYEKVTRSTTKANYSSRKIITDTMERLLTEKYVLIASRLMQNLIRSNTCDVVEMEEMLASTHSGFAFPYNSPLKKLFDKQISLLYEMGVVTKVESMWMDKPKICSVPVHQLKLNDVMAVMIACTVCIALAFIVLLVEVMKRKI